MKVKQRKHVNEKRNTSDCFDLPIFLARVLQNHSKEVIDRIFMLFYF